MNLFSFSHLNNLRSSHATPIEALQILLIFIGLFVVIYVLVGLIQDLLGRIGL